MKRFIVASGSNKPNKTQLRSEFVKLATQIRDMSKYEFVEILKNNDFDTANKWIEQLRDLYNEFSAQFSVDNSYVVAKVIVDGEFVGYASKVKKQSGSRGWAGRSILSVTDNIDEALRFANSAEASKALYKGADITVWVARDKAYKYEYGESDKPGVAGTQDEFASMVNEATILYAGDIHFEFEEV